jgi:hypothetical protein
LSLSYSTLVSLCSFIIFFLNLSSSRDFVPRPEFWWIQYFGNWILLHPQIGGWDGSALLGTLERDNISHWTGSF